MSNLPKISYPTVNISIPPAKKQYMFRPMLVKEEKLLLMAKVSADQTDILQTIKQVVSLCSIDPSFDVDKLPLYALEYVFTKLRSFSIGNIVKVSFIDNEDGKNYEFEVDLDKAIIKYPESVDTKIQINSKAGIIMKCPPATLYDDKEFLKSEDDNQGIYKLIVKCIDQIYDETNVYQPKDFTEEELLEFVELIDLKSFEKINSFMNNLPTLYYKIEYKNSKGSDRKIELTSLSDFFILH